MRLLKREKSRWFKNKYDFSLTEFNPQNIPSYAILSHRWGSEEVTLKDIEDGTAKTKAGYRKLEFCAQQADSDGLLYFWIDTCCIDKSNSTELSEAINSMFKWYKNATKCYVYLPDVSTYDNAGGVSAEHKWGPSFQESQWFTRGWTLQELVAPRTVEFFSVEGTLLGSKESLEQRIHQVTGIPVEALRGESIFQFDVSDRMSWAAGRQTTIEEDAVYCLLGLFDVHMPLIYGEGQQKALARLESEIRTLTNRTAFVAADAPWIVPLERNPRFTGRESQLAELEGKIFSKGYTPKIAIIGLGGMGKTQLVLELLYRTREKYKDCSVMWIPVTNAESLQQGYLKVAQQLAIPGCQDEKLDVKRLVQEHLSRDDAGRWLLVFDNADDIEMWMASVMLGKRKRNNTDESGEQPLQESYRLIDCLPKSKQGCIIFTTRDRKAAVKLAQQNIVELSAMDHDTASDLLKKCLANPHLVDDKTRDTAQLLETLTCLPLAITQAAAYINENGIHLRDYLSLLEEKEEQIIDLLSEEFEDDGRYRDIKNPVITTWLISFERVRRYDSLAADYLSFIACIGPKDVPQSLLPPGPSRKREVEAIGTLTAYSFITKQSTGSTLDLHRLVHLATRNWLRKEGLLNHWIEKAIVRLEDVFPNDNHENRSLWRMYLPHVLQALDYGSAYQEDGARLRLMFRCGECLVSEGRWIEAEALFKQVLAKEKETLGEEHPDTLITKAELAAAYWYQGRWKEAEALEAEVLEVRRQKFGEDDPSTLGVMNNIASTYRHQGRWSEAEKLGLQVLEIRKAKLGDEHLDTLTSMNNLALSYWHQGRYTEAEELESRVLKIRREKLGVEHPDTLNSMTNLASVYWNQQRYEEAEKLEIQVSEIRRATLGEDHPDTLLIMNNLASTYKYQDRWDEAAELETHLLETRKRKLGTDHPHTLTAMNNLALTLWHKGQWDKAEEIELQVLATRTKLLGVNHPNTLISMFNLAFTLRDSGRVMEAIQMMRDCLQRRIRFLGPKHPDTLASQSNLDSWKARHPDIFDQIVAQEDKDRSDEGTTSNHQETEIVGNSINMEIRNG